MQAKYLGLCYLLLLFAWIPLHAETVRVGPTRELKTLAAAANVVASGTTVEVDAGVYERDVAVWTQDQLTLRAVGGRVLLKANGAHAESKAIWVMRGGQVTVDGFDFSGAEVPDHNGAGIRLEAGRLLVRNCRFIDNENGILTGNNPEAELEIISSEFAHNGYGDGQSHNLYVGAIAKLTVTGSYLHHANVGHLLKTRAAVNDIRYNRLTDEPGGRASYELEFAIGGVAYVVGNIIEQGAQTQNPHLVSYGAEGYRWPKNELYLVNNTLVDDRPDGGIFLRVKPGNVTVKAANNLLVGRGKLESAGPGNYQNNINVSASEFEQPPLTSSYRLKRNSSLAGKAVDPGTVDGVSLRPDAQYVHPMRIQALVGKSRNPGAMLPVRGEAKP